jgi:hypothetical protein
MNAVDHLIAWAPEIQAGIMKSHSDLHISRLPVACRFGAGLRGFVCRFRGKFPEISKQNGKCGCKLLILLGGNSTGSQEVAGSIPASSTKNLQKKKLISPTKILIFCCMLWGNTRVTTGRNFCL